MTGLRTIVAAVDLSPASAPALVHAADLSKRTGATLHVLFAHLMFRSEATFGTTADPVLRLRVERFIADSLGISRADLDEMQPVVAIERDVSAQNAICAYSSREEADLLVLGTHGRTGVGRLLLGSVAEGCVGRAPCPVLTVPENAIPPSQNTSAPILVPVDFSPRTEVSLAAAKGLARLYGAPMEALHVIRDAGPYPSLTPDLVGVSDVDPQESERITERLHALGEDFATCHVEYGTPARAIAQVAAAHNARLVVLTTHARRGVARLAMGSVAEATLRHAPCPVLTLTSGTRGGRDHRHSKRTALAT